MTQALEVDEADRLNESDEPPRPPSPWTARRIGVMLAPAMIFLGLRELGLLALTWMNATHTQSMSMGQTLSQWDGLWFLGIADSGYDGVDPNLVDAYGHRSGTTSMAFFPGYPTAVRWMHEATCTFPTMMGIQPTFATAIAPHREDLGILRASTSATSKDTIASPWIRLERPGSLTPL